MQEAQGIADEATRQHLRSLIEEGIASGDYQPADAVFAELRQYTKQLATQRPA